ncbi:hypothetical protein [Saccharopolyspora hordei]|uniref:Uncharacterized protein n=1 Tax=Saccharopolyspora hordei TaxID=1838 RepID=A0A853ABI9_9PSEU|nr:hypothetical protein [Saccharopolyspora hordei]NYI81475.1 hypothetical protein [Saccharopolyspora hordei]
MRKQIEVQHDVEQAVRAYEAALVEADVAGRHARPDEEPQRLRDLRMRVVRLAEALPSTCWPRDKCGHCGGEREVPAVQARYGAGSSPKFVPSRRPCPRCRGTGLTLDLPSDSGEPPATDA